MDARARKWAIAAALLAFAALRIHAVHHVAFNWDEFAVLHDVARTAEEGVLHSGGHAGLPQAALLPLVSGCRDEIEVGRAARIAWLLLTWLGLAGLFALLVQLLPEGPHRRHDAALGTALLGLAPVFLEWSLQVRTDQVALAGGTWGAAALVASRRRPVLALVAGISFGLGWLGTQKLAYLAALGGLLAAGNLFARDEWHWRREPTRGALLGIGAAAVVLGWRALVLVAFDVRESHPALIGTESVGGYLDVFDFYRKTIGVSQYVAALPYLGVHVALFLAMVAATLASPAARTRRLALAWATAALALAIGAFHAAAFAYFLMILGVVVCAALALALPSLRAALAPRWPGAARLASPVLWGGLLLFAALQSIDMLRDTQTVQRDSLRFVHAGFAPEHAGFHPEKAPFCGARQPIRLFFSQHIYQTFENDEREERIARFIDRFRSEPIYYLIQSFRLNQFPIEIRRFWDEHYQPYRDAVFVAGRRFAGSDGQREPFDLLIDANYRWLPVGDHPVRVDGQHLAPGEVAFLAAGPHELAFESEGTRGLLVLAVDEPPRGAPRSFYKGY